MIGTTDRDAFVEAAGKDMIVTLVGLATVTDPKGEVVGIKICEGMDMVEAEVITLEMAGVERCVLPTQ